MNAFIKFNKGLFRQPVYVRLWMAVLIIANMVLPLFFLGTVEAKVVLACLMGSVVFMTVITAMTGYTRLLGAGHVLWFPMIFYLWSRLGLYPADGFFEMWLRAVILLNTISLVIDVIEVIRYAAGDRNELTVDPA